MKTPAIETPANGTSESNQENTSVHDASAAHLNGKAEQPTIETKPAADNKVKQGEVSTSVSKSTEKTVHDEPSTRVPEFHAPPAAEPVSTPTVNEGSASAIAAKEETAPTSHVETTIADPPAEVAAVAEPDTPGAKGKSPRGKAKAPVVAVVAPTRQSARSRNPVTSSSANGEENQAMEEGDAPSTTTSAEKNQASKRTKRQAATIAKDAIAASHQPNSTSGSSIADDGNDQDAIPSDLDDEDEVTGGNAKKPSPSPRMSVGKKRGSATPASQSSKRASAKASITSMDAGDGAEGTAAAAAPTATATPPKRARTSVVKTTPEPSEEYVRKLRPRK